MATQVVISIYSGRPNPRFTLSDQQEEELRARLARLRTARRERIASINPFGLGVIQVSRLSTKCLTTFSISRGIIDFPSLPTSFADTSGVTKYLLGCAPVKALPPGERRIVTKIFSADLPIAARRVRTTLAVVCNPSRTKDATPFDAGWASAVTPDGPQNRNPCNNCYDYANQQLTDTFSQPGLGSGLIYASIDCPSITAAAVRDGLIAVSGVKKHRVPLRAGGGWYVALFMGELAPGIPDYHWVKQDKNGCWSHKSGRSGPQDIDFAWQKIRTAHTAKFIDPLAVVVNKYPTFCGYFRTTHNATIKGYGNPQEPTCQPHWF